MDEPRFTGHDERFTELVADASAFLAECEREVAWWGWAPLDVTLHVPEPMYREREIHEDRRVAEPLPGEPPDDFFNAYWLYGVDAGGQIVYVRRCRQGPWDRGVRWSTAGEALWSATEVGAGSLELTSYRYEHGRMTASRATSLCRSRHGESVSESLSWFEYDGDGRLDCVVQASSRSEGTWYPEVDRLYWADGRLDLVTSTYGQASVPGGDSPDDLRAAVLAWERDRAPGKPVVLRGRLERGEVSIVYDDRMDRLETEFPGEEALLELLPALMADAVDAAARAVIDHELVTAPFLLDSFAGFPPSAELVDDAARSRRQSLPAQDSLLFFPEAVDLAVVDHASPEALKRCRQIRQLPRPPATHPRRPDDEEGHRRRLLEGQRELDRTERYRAALQTEFNARKLPGAAEDFVAIVRSDSVDREAALESTLGADGAAAFRATLRPDQPIKLPRGPGQLRDLDDVRLLLRSRGVRDDLVEPIATRAQWGVRLVPGEGRSHLGGLPALGSHRWPMFDGAPLNFVAQIELAELPGIPGRAQLPADGRLLFFYGLHLEHPFEPSTAGPDDPARVLYLPPNTPDVPVTPPSDLETSRVKALHPASRLTLPDPGALNDLALDWYDSVGYRRALERAAAIKDPARTDRSSHQILGQPTFIQDDPRANPEATTTDWKLLLSVHDDSSIGLAIADGGALYFFISDDALAACDWTSIQVEPQSH